MLKILHIVSEDKFIIDAKIVMDAVTNTSNRYMCLVKNEKNYIPTYVKKLDFVEIVSIETMREIIIKDEIDIVAFHSIPYECYENVFDIPKKVKIWWLVWGYDIYTDTSGYDIQPIVPLNLYKSQTNKYIRSKLPPKPTIYEYIKKKIKIIVNYNGNRDREIKRLKEIQSVRELCQNVLKRIDFISTVLPLEYEMLAKTKGFHAKYIPFQYAFITNETQSHKSKEASYILLGNSSDPTNNHLDILDIINKQNISNKVYIPLAYGDSEYKKFLEERIGGNENILIQDDFVAREKYMSILCNCRVAVFGHVRQQALGNIAMAIMLGMKVFLYKNSVCYKYMKQNGFVVYTIEKDLSQKSINEPMPDYIENNNRAKITKMFSYDSVQFAVQTFFRAVEAEIKNK